MKTQIKKLVGNTASSTNDNKELKVSVARIDNHMMKYNDGMKSLTNFVKVLKLKVGLSIKF